MSRPIDRFHITIPWKHVRIWNYRDLPNLPGVYSALRLRPDAESFPLTDSFDCLYIGSTGSLLERWRKGHHCAIDALKHGCTHIGYLELRNKYEAEVYKAELIKSFDPALNKRAGKSWDYTLNPFEKLRAISFEYLDLRRFIYVNFALNSEAIERDVRSRLGLEWEQE